MKRKRIFTAIIIVFCGTSILFCQNTSNQARTKSSIIKSIENDNATSSSKITFHQDSRIDNLLNAYINRVDLSSPYTGPGYRVQVFSSNNFRTAKTDAANIEKQLRAAFPQHQVYVVYTSPFWKVRVGDFRTATDAQKLHSEIITQFPGLKKDTYAVRENQVKID